MTTIRSVRKMPNEVLLAQLAKHGVEIDETQIEAQ